MTTTSSLTPRLQLPLIEGGQALKHITHNEALLDLDTLLFIVLATLSAVVPPEGDAAVSVIVGEGATGAFAGREGQIASRVNGAWRFRAPSAGLTAWLEEDGTHRVFDGAAWQVVSGGSSDTTDGELPESVAQLGIGTSADTTNRLAVKSPAALFTHDDQSDAPTGDVRLNLNRASESDTATLNFQTDYQGAAEFGLAGDGDFRIKTSADGTDFTTALRVSPATGHVGIGEGAPGHALDINGAREGEPLRVGVTNAFTAPGSDAALTLRSGAKYDFALTQQSNGTTRLNATGPSMIYVALSTHFFFLRTRLALRLSAVAVHCALPLGLPKFTVAKLPAPSAGHVVFVSDDAQGPGPAYGDGTAWRRMSDRSLVD